MPDDMPDAAYNQVSARLLTLLDYAYDAAENPNGFDGLFTAADRFFFPRSADAGLADDLDEAGALTDHLDGHISRMQKLMSRAEVDMAAGSRGGVGPQLANLVFSDDGQRIVGNQVAATLLGVGFPTSLAKLGLARKSDTAIQDCLAGLRSGQFEGSCILPIQRDDDPKPYLARCTKLQSRGPDGRERRGLSVAINHVDWREDALTHASEMFGLTKAETELLGCLLQDMSYPMAAEKLDKSRETVKAQGKAILRKTGTTQMSDVISFMMGYAYLAEPTNTATPETGGAFSMQGPHDVIRSEDGRDIQINRYGKPGGRPLLFFHGLYQGPYLTDKLHKGFAARGYDIFAPSRPGFNRTSAPATWPVFNATVTADVVAVCDHYGLENIDFVVHQAGISFACRAAQALGTRVGSAAMIGAGVPIKDHMLKTMHTEARVAAAAAKYAPKLLDVLLRLGIAKWRRQGPYAYLSNLFPEGQPDRDTLNDPDTGPVMERGILHMISQGAQTIMYDGFSAMSDWDDIYPHLPARQLWLHGAQDPVMNAQFVQDFLAQNGQPAAHIYPDRGGDVLLAAADDVLEKLDLFYTA